MNGQLSSGGNGDQIKYFLGGVLFGAVIGGAFALLYAPMKGEDTRRMLQERAVQAERMAAERANQMKETAGEMAADVRGRADAVVADVRDRAGAVKKRGEEMLDCLKEQKA